MGLALKEKLKAGKKIGQFNKEISKKNELLQDKDQQLVTQI